MYPNPISYPGNKNKIVEQLVSLFPSECNEFVDVMCGGGTVGVNSEQKNIVLNDSNHLIIDLLKFFYNTSFSQIDNMLSVIIKEYNLTDTKVHEKGHYIEYRHEGLSLYNKEGYNKLKAEYNISPSNDKLLALLIYGFNHYLRVNGKGLFNVPVGKVDYSEKIKTNLNNFLYLMQSKNIKFSCFEYTDKRLYANKSAFYYFDPPYLITTAPYNANWNEKNEEALLDVLDFLNRQNIKFGLSNVLMSNNKHNVMLELWAKKYIVHEIKRQYRNANYQKINVTDTREVLITNY